jgi:hypothetical protein
MSEIECGGGKLTGVGMERRGRWKFSGTGLGWLLIGIISVVVQPIFAPDMDEMSEEGAVLVWCELVNLGAGWF